MIARGRFKRPLQVGETANALRVQLVDTAGDPVSVISATFKMVDREDPTTVIVNNAACENDPVDGLVVYQQQAADVATAGRYLCQYTCQTAGGVLPVIVLELDIAPNV